MMGAIERRPNPLRPKSTQLMYVDVIVNDRKAQAMVDTGATHNFASENEAKRLDLKLDRE